MALFHDADRGGEAEIAAEEDGLGVAVADGLELLEPAGEDRGDAVGREGGVDADDLLFGAMGELAVGVVIEALLEQGNAVCWQGKADSEGVTAEAGEEIGAAFEGVEELESVDGAAGAVGHAVFHTDDDGGLGGALDDAGGEDADDATVPTVAGDDEHFVGGELGFGGEAVFNLAEGLSFGFAAVEVELLELGGELAGAGGVAGGEELDDFCCDVHAAGGVDAGAETEAEIVAGDFLAGGIELGDGHEGAKAGPGGFAELANASGGEDAILSAEGDGVGDGSDGDHFEKGREDFAAGAGFVLAFEESLCELEGDGCAAEGFFRVGAAGLVGIEDGECVGDGVAGFGQVMVGDDEVEAKAACGVGFSKGAHAGVDGDDKADAGEGFFFEDGGLEAVALFEAVGNVEVNDGAVGAGGHLNGGFEQDYRSGAIDVVVAIEEDGFVLGDGVFEACDGAAHAEHEKWVVEVVDGGIEELEGGFRGVDAAGDEQFCEGVRNAGLGGEKGAFLGMLRSQFPALGNGGPGCGSGLCGVAHRSSGPSSGSSIMMSLRPSMFSTSSW